MKKTLLIVLTILLVSLVAFAQTAPTTAPKPAAQIQLTDDEQKEILGIQSQIDKLILMRENAILRAANEHGVSLRKYELAQSGGQLVFTERAQVSQEKGKP